MDPSLPWILLQDSQHPKRALDKSQKSKIQKKKSTYIIITFVSLQQHVTLQSSFLWYQILLKGKTVIQHSHIGRVTLHMFTREPGTIAGQKKGPKEPKNKHHQTTKNPTHKSGSIKINIMQAREPHFQI